MQMRVDPGDIQAVKVIARRVGDDAPVVLMRTINGSLISTRAKAAQQIKADLNLTSRRIRQDFSIQRANRHNLNANVKSTGKPVPLKDFIGTRSVQRGVSVKVKRSGGREIIQHAFIGGSGNHVRRRINRLGEGTGRGRVGYFARLPWDHPMKKTEILTGPRIEDIFAKPRVMEPVLEYTGQRLVTIANQQVARLLAVR